MFSLTTVCRYQGIYVSITTGAAAYVERERRARRKQRHVSRPHIAPIHQRIPDRDRRSGRFQPTDAVRFVPNPAHVHPAAGSLFSFFQSFHIHFTIHWKNRRVDKINKCMNEWMKSRKGKRWRRRRRCSSWRTAWWVKWVPVRWACRRPALRCAATASGRWAAAPWIFASGTMSSSRTTRSAWSSDRLSTTSQSPGHFSNNFLDIFNRPFKTPQDALRRFQMLSDAFVISWTVGWSYSKYSKLPEGLVWCPSLDRALGCFRMLWRFISRFNIL